MSTFLPINLPSQCLPYAEVSPENITIRSYIARDEIYLAEINPINLEAKYLLVLKNVLKGIDPAKLTLGDRLYIMLWEYINSYSHTMKLGVTCSHCLQDSEIIVDLTKLDFVKLPDDFTSPHKVHLPDKNKDIHLQLLTVQDEIATERYSQTSPDGHLYKFARSIVNDEVDVLARMEDLGNLSAKDLAKIRAFQLKYYHGPDMLTKYTCSKCGEVDDVNVPFRLDFFYPDGKTLTDTFGEGI